MTYVVLLARALTFVTFSFSFAMKVRSGSSRRMFREAVEDLGVATRKWSRPLAIAVLSCEGVIALSTLVGGTLLVPGLLLAFASLVAFSVVLGRTLVRRRTVNCNCFGSGSSTVSWFDVTRNAILATLAAVGAAAALREGVETAPPYECAVSVAVAVVCLSILLSLRNVSLLLGLRVARGPKR